MNHTLPPNLAQALAEGLERLRPLAGADSFDPNVPAALVQAGLHRLPVPEAAGGLGGRLTDAIEVLAAIGALDGSAGLGLAMHYHTLGSAVESGCWPAKLLHEVFSAVCEQWALVKLAATEARGGSPARGAVPELTARRLGSNWLVDGEKSWTTWLPALRYAVVTAKLLDGQADVAGETVRLGSLLIDLSLPGVACLSGFDGLGMTASASGLLRFSGVCVADDRLIGSRLAGEGDPHRASALAWFGLCVAAVYLGIGEGARAALVRWAVGRKPGDGAMAVADIPSVRMRLGRLDTELRAGRILLFATARLWEEARSVGRREHCLPDIALAKLKATEAAAFATDHALRIAGGPGFLRGELERAFRDARAGLIHPPLEDVAYLEFARHLIEGQRSAYNAAD